MEKGAIPSGGGGGVGSIGGGGVGPTGSNSGGANEAVDHIHRDDVSSSSLDAITSAMSTNPQPFDIFASYSTNPYKSPGGNMAFPFTSGQWKELERQAMIYKYMISSMPVPPHLLYPLSRNFPASNVDPSVSSLYNVGYSKNGVPEPGRCKRTDGKKWRCSRDVAPHQKYCERHLHRGRPRSRKPVEAKNNGENLKKPRLEQTQQFNDKPLLLFNANTDLSISTAPSSYKGTNRDLGLMMESEMVLEPNMGFANEGSSFYTSNALFHQDYMEHQPINHLLSYSDLSTNHGNLSPSLDLSIAMSAGNVLDDEEMGNVQMRDVVKFCDEDSKWLSPVCWEPFAPGGPLAEALQLGSGVVGCTNPTSPHNSIGPATTVSSPSGVLQRTLFSHSDSSVCNSPSEIAFQWLK
ncbi:hypothetical protein DH2020_045721 [Rehmannia glutinosa]|uniref:Growth-regulating factor n=1 Tax=Rehmannia glutinosa TaxID=99300 RepID=A0ABR0UE01_REHGL